MTDTVNQFGNLVKELRVKRGYSKTGLAKEIGVSDALISHFECGRRIPSVEVAIRLSKALDVSLDTLLAPVPA